MFLTIEINDIIIFSLLGLLLISVIILLLIIIKNNNLIRDLKFKIENKNNDFERFNLLKQDINHSLFEFQNMISNTLSKQITESTRITDQKIDLFTKIESDMLSRFEKAVNNNTLLLEKKLSEIRESMERSIINLQNENNKKLDEMRNIVDDKLQKTLDDKLNNSYKLIDEKLQKVFEGLGEMQTVAESVGDLKKVLSNVKTRGILGETQLGLILEQILSSEQYDTNVVTKVGSNEPVEFAVKLPGDDKNVYLPIDSKFPLDIYSSLIEAYESNDTSRIEQNKKELTNRIKKFGKDICDKYIDVPNTTEFGIMFLPVEGLYAEVVKSGVTEDLQRNYKIIVAGPTTMAALLNSLQMGFKTLAIQKRSSEVWNILGAVKTEFENFSSTLTSTQTRLNQASDELDKLVGVRTRKIIKKLDDVAKLNNNTKKIIE